jgi:hypothetical protein
MISVEAFLWHPHSIKYSVDESKYAYNDQLLASMEDDSDSETPSNLRVELPPRLVVTGKHEYNLQQVAEDWAARRRYNVVALGHVVACAISRKLLFVDFVLEKEAGNNRGGGRQYVLACVYYSKCRGGNDLQIARHYMQQVQQVCNAQMQFFPRMLALCAYDGSQASAFFCSNSRRSSSKRAMLGRFDMRRTAAWRGKRQPKVYAMDVTNVL